MGLVAPLWFSSIKIGDDGSFPSMQERGNKFGMKSNPLPLRYKWLKRRQRRAGASLRRLTNLNFFQRKSCFVKHHQLENDDDDFSVDCEKSSLENTYTSYIFPHEVPDVPMDSMTVVSSENTAESKSIHSSLEYSFDSSILPSIASMSSNICLESIPSKCESKCTSNESSLDYSAISTTSSSSSVDSAYSARSWFDLLEFQDSEKPEMTLEFSKESSGLKEKSRNNTLVERGSIDQTVKANFNHANSLSLLENQGLWDIEALDSEIPSDSPIFLKLEEEKPYPFLDESEKSDGQISGKVRYLAFFPADSNDQLTQDTILANTRHCEEVFSAEESANISNRSSGLDDPHLLHGEFLQEKRVSPLKTSAVTLTTSRKDTPLLSESSARDSRWARLQRIRGRQC